MFIIRNHGSEVLNRHDQRVFFPLEVARCLIARSRQRKKNSLGTFVIVPVGTEPVAGTLELDFFLDDMTVLGLL